MSIARLQHHLGILKLGSSRSRPREQEVEAIMGTFETLAVVAAVYAVVFIAHITTRTREQNGTRTLHALDD